jgi:aminoglycoside phosphotransferase family enzyme
VSVVVFAGDRAYKLKKPVHTPFLDFSTPALRERACRREVELNRRLAPDVYLGVAPVLGPDGAPCDHLVVMRRMPAERRLSRLVGPRAAGGRCLEAVASVVAAFHSDAGGGPEVRAEGTRDALAARWEANFSEMQPFLPELPDPDVHHRIERLARAYLAGRGPLFDRRVADGFVRDGHGDLLADDIFCLDDGPRILDCLEFDDRLRYVDGLDDAAFLAMDLERLGAPEAAGRFLDAYRRASARDQPAGLAHHYIAYRAHVRAKVAALRHAQGDPEALDQAAHLLEISEAHLRAARVVLVVVGGLPGTGKSTLAAGLARARGWGLVRSDEVRKELAAAHGTPAADRGYRTGLYAPEVTDATYDELLRRARELLGMGTSAVLDASWTSEAKRSAVAGLARACHADLVALHCRVPADVAALRIEARARRGGDPSDATPAVARSMALDEDPWPEATAVDTSGHPEDALAAAEAAVARELARPGRPPDSGPFGP